MENKVKFCVVCGRKIPEISLRQKVCSDFCLRRKKEWICTLYQKEAQKKGMSYGKYVASLTNTGRKGGIEK